MDEATPSSGADAADPFGDEPLDLFGSDPIVHDGPDPFSQDGPDLFGSDEGTVEGSSPEPVEEAPVGATLPELVGGTTEGAEGSRSDSSTGSESESRTFAGAGSSPRPEAPLALYRRYRPETFAEVIGQDHVTQPLQRALINNRVNHAYLFSGPRGCGKTTSARILARTLNCAKGPAPIPCGECQSCRDLARGGAGSIDVIEIDAASHGGVNEARDLRERAFFAPVHSRYKIYIIDEAHMVTKEGFNALLKVVEEPPPHVKFIFATTEPEKVLGTIRSRTHHYPFRLLPPKLLAGYLNQICEAEGIHVEPAVLPLVVRAGQGSVRDSLSVLDQLLGGAAEAGVSYHQAAALLGYTPDTLLDEIVDAFAAGDAAGVFATVDKIIEVGQDPRRFAEDLLRRLRDLVIVAAVPDALGTGLVDVSPEQAERYSSQAAALGSGELTRAAEVIATGLTDMRGTTAPRLHLELMCARVLLPGADVDGRGVHARLDRLERRLGMPGESSGDTDPRPEASSRPVAEVSPRAPHEPTAPAQPTPEPTSPPPGGGSPASPRSGSAPPERAHQQGPGGRGSGPEPSGRAPQRASEQPGRPSEPPSAVSVPTTSGSGGMAAADVRRLWPDVLEEVKRRRRFTWILLSQNAQVTDVNGGVLTLGMANAGARDSFARGGSADVLREALIAVMGLDLRVEVIVDEGGPTGSSSAAPTPPTPGPARPEPQSSPDLPTAEGVLDHSQPRAREERPGPSPQASNDSRPAEQAVAMARANIRPTRVNGSSLPDPDDEEPDISRDDVTLGEDDLASRELLAQHLDAELIGEEDPEA